MSQLKNLRTSLVLVALLAATPSFAGDGEITGGACAIYCWTGETFPIGSKSRCVLYQWTHSRVANSTSSRPRQGPRLALFYDGHDLTFPKPGLPHSLSFRIARKSNILWSDIREAYTTSSNLLGLD